VDELILLAWKRRIFALYAEVRASSDPEAGWRHWCEVRSELYRTHPQSPRPGSAPAYFPYDARARVEAAVQEVEPVTLEIPGSAGTRIRFGRFAVARFTLAGMERELELYWLDAYGGGIFLPFGDATNRQETYGAGRYLLDTVKGADLGGGGDELVLDFNFAFNPSCAYDESWACPLSPPKNRLSLRVEAGELLP
jgi:uncharacterized protein